ncbi:hypothetical protein [Leptolyngbya sp. FACHB-261]|uniref:hypothetical protein n=1 Tax=Leptolyngbya sp. FACHB-261 TaxID=2692806 RepID=UPI0016857285|nr:hypothetical protein [Leptolyngbya sp. FACHB-261]
MITSANCTKLDQLESLEERFQRSLLAAAARGIADTFKDCLVWNTTEARWIYQAYRGSESCYHYIYTDAQLLSWLFDEQKVSVLNFSEQDLGAVLRLLKQELTGSIQP